MTALDGPFVVDRLGWALDDSAWTPSSDCRSMHGRGPGPYLLWAHSAGDGALFTQRLFVICLFIVFLLQLANLLPQLFKQCILAPWSGFEDGFATVNNSATVTVVLCFPI